MRSRGPVALGHFAIAVDASLEASCHFLDAEATTDKLKTFNPRVTVQDKRGCTTLDISTNCVKDALDGSHLKLTSRAIRRQFDALREAFNTHDQSEKHRICITMSSDQRAAGPGQMSPTMTYFFQAYSIKNCDWQRGWLAKRPKARILNPGTVIRLDNTSGNTKACYTCNSTDHLARDCPLTRRDFAAPTASNEIERMMLAYREAAETGTEVSYVANAPLDGSPALGTGAGTGVRVSAWNRIVDEWQQEQEER
ncbi:uncharacterized protein B0I36DRAFT_362770 [Microdochium trichocladiopsis]|uniref:CCHC-type domain-containing protein n=1 Tax=Microdochium trichocladiopsis TaxID=1682393 RepID=A0A9P8Y6U6_9PEZI|nr:uncharacterized protein B0I36DRAFT_362770 [Microdochium trichocladiopsis]KAH7030988.1 hypothetical protein B0I36DRAFT_362770 [Microdochium trichocladiopsis]